MGGRHAFFVGLFAIVGALGAISCSSSSSASPQDPQETEDSGIQDDAGDIDTSTIDAQPDVEQDTQTTVDASQETAAQDPPDGTPSRQQCISSKFGKLPAAAIDSNGEYRYGRLDGILIAIVPPSSKNSCKADDSHVHLQVLMSGSVLDIAVNVDDEGSTAGTGIYYATADAVVPGGVWKEGFNTYDRLDYVKHLGLHSASFQKYTTAQLKTKVIAELENANHISIFMTPYSDGTGGHLVHYNGPGYDGAVVVRPLNAIPHVLAFRFSDKTF
jgi:hypothetical protein